MIEIPTTLILGAGASAHLGYPVGKDLVNQICQRLLHNNTSTFKALLRHAYSGDMLFSFKYSLSRSLYPSIDTFLETNQEYIELGKLLITYVLKDNEDYDRLFPPNDPG